MWILTLVQRTFNRSKIWNDLFGFLGTQVIYLD